MSGSSRGLSRRHEVGAVIFEIARSEINYTLQWPAEYSTVIQAAAIREGYRGPLFLQGDHFQVKAKIFREDPEIEIAAIKLLIRDAIAVRWPDDGIVGGGRCGA